MVKEEEASRWKRTAENDSKKDRGIDWGMASNCQRVIVYVKLEVTKNPGKDLKSEKRPNPSRNSREEGNTSNAGLSWLLLVKLVILRPREEVINDHHTPLDASQVAIVRRAAISEAIHTHQVYLVFSHKQRFGRAEIGLPLVASVGRDL